MTNSIFRKTRALPSGVCDLCLLPKTTVRQRWCQSCLASFCCAKPRCQCCGLQLESSASLCGQCLQSPPPWQRLFCLGDYTFPISWYIKQLKYHGQFLIADDLCGLLASRITSPAQAVMAVPMHWRRRWWRGYNHSELLARSLSQQLGIPYLHEIIKRTRHTKPQQGQSKRRRRHNLKKAFQLNHIPPVKHIAIVDDVVTTGSTVRNLCQLLLEVGVERIDIYCICRTPEPSESTLALSP